MSAHADASELMTWLKNFKRPPEMTWLVHGEPSGIEALEGRIEQELGWRAQAGEYLHKVDLSAAPTATAS